MIEFSAFCKSIARLAIATWNSKQALICKRFIGVWTMEVWPGVKRSGQGLKVLKP